MVQMAVHTPNAVLSGQNTVQHLGDNGVKPGRRRASIVRSTLNLGIVWPQTGQTTRPNRTAPAKWFLPGSP
jgi:hypothetical protein